MQKVRVLVEAKIFGAKRKTCYVRCVKLNMTKKFHRNVIGAHCDVWSRTRGMRAQEQNKFEAVEIKCLVSSCRLTRLEK